MSLQDLVANRQHNRLLRLSFPNGDGPASTLLVNRLDAYECLSRPFEFKVELLSDDPNIALKDLQGKMLCVALVRRDGTMRYFTGRVFGFALKTVDGGVSYYQADLGPWYRYTSMRKDNYLFHYTTMYDQTASIFGDYGGLADWDWRVQGASDVLTDCCQFDESDRNFLELIGGEMKSLTGIESLAHLETIQIESAAKLVDVSALLAAPILKNIKFSQYKKVTDWSFLGAKKSLECLRFDLVDSASFINELPNIKYFWSKRVADRKNKTIHFQNDEGYENMDPEGEVTVRDPSRSVFDAPLR